MCHNFYDIPYKPPYSSQIEALINCGGVDVLTVRLSIYNIENDKLYAFE